MEKYKQSDSVKIPGQTTVNQLPAENSNQSVARRAFLKTAASAVLGLACTFSETKLLATPFESKIVASAGHSYYLSSSEGNDSNEGTQDAPWKTLSKISSVSLFPEDTVYFKKGDRFEGHFVVNGSGSNGRPILITAYGTGSKPVITGEVGAEQGGDYQEAIYVNNHDHLMFDGLEVRNERKVSRSDVNDVDAYGMYFNNTGTKVMKHFILRNMTFRKVYAVKPMTSRKEFNHLKVSAIRFSSEKNTHAGKEKNIQDVLIENCDFTDIQRLGVFFSHAGGKEGVGNDAINRNKDIVVRNNEFHYLGGTCVLPTSTYNCLIENNLFDHPGSSVDPRMSGRGSSVWPYHCVNTVIQHNRCISIRGYYDSCGIHIDNKNVNTFVQYNYMEDCEGGFVEILDGNVNSVYRFNVSVNDGWRKSPPGTPGFAQGHTIWISDGHKEGLSENNYIYNNTVYVDKDFPTSIIIQVRNTFIFNNIFYSGNGGKIGGENVIFKNHDAPFFMSNNLFFGTVASKFVELDKDPIKANPDFVGKGSDGARFQLSVKSSAINRGVIKPVPPISGAGTGVFKNVPAYPKVDFYGNPVDMSSGTPNIGACDAKHGELVFTLK